MSVQTCTFFPDYPDRDDYQSLTLAFPTDTQNAQTLVPVFLIHSLQFPFCDNPRCVCQEQRNQKTSLLASIIRGEITLHHASSFQEERKG